MNRSHVSLVALAALVGLGGAGASDGLYTINAHRGGYMPDIGYSFVNAPRHLCCTSGKGGRRRSKSRRRARTRRVCKSGRTHR